MWGRIPTSLAKAISVFVPNIRPNHVPLSVTLETNRLARLAPAAVVLTTPTTTILATVTHAPPSPSNNKNNSGVPLLVDFRSKAAAVGIIPSTWTRREQQPAPYEITTARLIDRSLRPSLQNASKNGSMPSTHISVSVLSAERNADAPIDALAVNAASAALALAFQTTSQSASSLVTAARVALIKSTDETNGEKYQCVPFPSDAELQNAYLSLFAAVNAKGNVLAMSINARASPVLERDILSALKTTIEAALSLQPSVLSFQKDVHAFHEKEGKSSFPPRPPQAAVFTENTKDTSVDENRFSKLQTVYDTALEAYDNAFVKCREHPGKAHRAAMMTEVQAELINTFVSESKSNNTEENELSLTMDDVLGQLSTASRQAHRKALARDGLRMDGRKFDEIRPIRCETGILPGDVHGSALFERGDTQVLAYSTIGHKHQLRRTEEYLDGTDGDVAEAAERFFVHYTFPSFATGEYGRFGQSQNRREIGHSLLTQRAIAPLLGNSEENEKNGDDDALPYALRVSTEVLGSDGSSSMASVCAGSMALMDSGAPLRKPVAGIAMGLVTVPAEDNDGEDKEIILTDILGAEDHFGDMDLKVAGTDEGVTACQLDVKREEGISFKTIETVLGKALAGRKKILEDMLKCGLTQPREISEGAPRTIKVKVNRERARNVLFRDRFKGLRAIGTECESYLSASDSGDEIVVEAPNKASAEKSERLIKEAVKEIRVGDVINVRVTEVKKTYAKVEGDHGSSSGLLHVSKMMLIEENRKDDNSDSNPGNKTYGSAYPDVRSVLNVNDKVNVRVIECDDAGHTIRYQLVQKPTGHERRLASEIDSILKAVQIDQSSA